MERQNFEDSWKDAFKNAEVTPSENAWRNIELELERAKGAQLRRSIFYYKMLAAASVILALMVGVGVYVNSNGALTGSELLAEEKTTSAIQEGVNASKQTPSEQAESSKLESANNSNNNIQANNSEGVKGTVKTDEVSITDVTPSQNRASIESPLPTSGHRTPIRNSKDEGQVNSGANTNDVANQTRYNNGTAPLIQNSGNVLLANNQPSFSGKKTESDILSFFAPALPSLAKIDRPALPQEHSQPHVVQVDPVLQMMAKLEQMERELSDKQEKRTKNNYKSEKLWTSVGFAAGAVSATNAGVTSSAQATSSLAMNKPQAENEAKASGLSYSFGLNVGTRVSNRWVVQGGLNYLTQSSDYTASTAVGSADFSNFTPQSINEIDKLKGASDDKRLIATAPYNVNNNLRYLSIPLQAGYLLVNKDFGVQVNAGVSTDLFLQNTVTAESENLSETTQRGGEDSPYKSVNVSGLVGTEVSYRFGDHYRLALNPGVRYPFSSIYRSGLDVKASPLTLDVGLKFRYIFK